MMIHDLNGPPRKPELYTFVATQRATQDLYEILREAYAKMPYNRTVVYPNWEQRIEFLAPEPPTIE